MFDQVGEFEDRPSAGEKQPSRRSGRRRPLMSATSYPAASHRPRGWKLVASLAVLTVAMTTLVQTGFGADAPRGRGGQRRNYHRQW